MTPPDLPVRPPARSLWRAGLSSADQAQFADEQLRLVWDHARIGLLVATAFAVMLAVYLQDLADPQRVRAWLIAKLAVSAARWLQSRAYARSEGGPAWRHASHAFLALDGLVWGLAGLWLMSSDIPTASLVGAALACVSCIATFGLQVSPWATASYVAPILLPTALGLLWRADEFGALGGAGLLMLLGLQLATAGQGQRRLAEGFVMRQRAQALARERNEALNLALRQSAVKSQFLGNVSHELRTPLHGMLGLARLVRDELPEGSTRRRLDLIDASGQHLLSLISDLLEVSRGDASRPAIRPQPLELTELLDQIVSLHALRARDRGLSLKLSEQLPRPCWVQGDGRRMGQVLHNLLGNALKFTDQGSVELTVQWSGDTGQALFEVRDTGPGIAPADQERIFEAFARADSLSGAMREGAGLGLTIARDLARAMGGDLQLDSQPGVGSCFRFSLSLPATTAPGDVRQGSASHPGAETSGDTALPPAAPVRNAATSDWLHPAGQAPAPRRVLLAEDDEVNAMIATACLEREGLQVLRVSDGRAAVQEALRPQGRPDLVLMDCRMPQLDGYGATREIRAQEYARGWPRVPVIALTATVTDLGRVQCMEAGMDDFIAKPYAPDELLAVVRAWLSARSLHEPAWAPRPEPV